MQDRRNPSSAYRHLPHNMMRAAFNMKLLDFSGILKEIEIPGDPL
jgi:hypothetical protein